MKNSIERFSNRVENYVKYRPGYPPEMLEVFRGEMNLTPESLIADIGSGTGISAKVFLENGNTVIGVEPNKAMREAAEEYLRAFPKFQSIDGTAENTNLEPGSIDIVIAAQAFHWFDPEKTRAEFQRILRPGGSAALIWNERRLTGDEFHEGYEKLLLKYGNDYERVRHENVDENILSGFFRSDFKRETLENAQVLDYEGLLGRLLSSSYMPTETDDRFAPLNAELHALFAKHSEHGMIKVLYDTNIFYTQL